MGKLPDLVEEVGAGDSSASRHRELQSRKRAITQDLESLAALVLKACVTQVCEQTVTALVNDLHRQLTYGTPSARRSFMRSFVREIRADRQGGEIDYVLPPQTVTYLCVVPPRGFEPLYPP